MSEWWSYTLSDFLMFSPRTYYRLLERHHAAVWPAHVAALGFGVTSLALLRRPTPARGRVISVMLAVLWAWVGWTFLWRRYGTINPAAAYGAPAFALEAALFLWLGTGPGRPRYEVSRGAAGGLGLALAVVGVALYPALAPLSGRPWRQAEVFGIAPDPTAIATLGLLVLASGRLRWELLAVPILWCSVSAATLGAMGAAEAIVPALAALLVVASAAMSGRTALALQRPPPEN